MWYEALPPLAIIGCLMYSYQIGSLLITKAFTGLPYRRETEDIFQRNMIQRDARISGLPWILRGLENLPDEPNPNDQSRYHVGDNV